jgi:hypothetical protein
MQPGLIDLTKKVETVISLRKMEGVVAQVGLCIDGSGSMQDLYSRGTVQKAVDRISAVACTFDDNKELDVWVFDGGVRQAKAATPDMFGSYVQKELLNTNLVQWGGTAFRPFINSVVSHYFDGKSVEQVSTSVIGAIKSLFGFGKKEVTPAKDVAAIPVYIVVFTDGENQDPSETTNALSLIQDKNVYWQFVGLGNCSFSYLKRLADSLPNVGFFPLTDLETIKDMELYKQLINEEFAIWVKNFKGK